MFGDTQYDVTRRVPAVPVEECLEAIQRLVVDGKVVAAALSNETPYGVCRAGWAAQEDPTRVARPVALQNAYSLVNRTFEESLLECCVELDVDLLAYSPLAMGLLTGKYNTVTRDQTRDDESMTTTTTTASGWEGREGRVVGRWGGGGRDRLNVLRGRYAEGETRYAARGPLVAAVRRYSEIAWGNGMDPAVLALRWALGRARVASLVVGVTDRGQLGTIVEACEKEGLPEEVLEAIDAVHAEWPNPAP